LLIVVGCAESLGSAQLTAAAPPTPPGEARIWFCRDWQASDSLNPANIDVNGSYSGPVANGGALS
jgi:hypothetical protein